MFAMVFDTVTVDVEPLTVDELFASSSSSSVGATPGGGGCRGGRGTRRPPPRPTNTRQKGEENGVIQDVLNKKTCLTRTFTSEVMYIILFCTGVYISNTMGDENNEPKKEKHCVEHSRCMTPRLSSISASYVVYQDAWFGNGFDTTRSPKLK